MFGGAYLQREIRVSKSIGLALQLEVNLPFLLCFTLYLSAIFQVQAPGGLIFGGAVKRRVFCVTGLGAYIWRGLFMAGLIFGILRYFLKNVNIKIKMCFFSGVLNTVYGSVLLDPQLHQ